jgi:hypothetical protein
MDEIGNLDQFVEVDAFHARAIKDGLGDASVDATTRIQKLALGPQLGDAPKPTRPSTFRASDGSTTAGISQRPEGLRIVSVFLQTAANSKAIAWSETSSRQ